MAFNTSTSAPIEQTINFLTRPLILSQTPDMITSLQLILRTTLQAALSEHQARLTLSFSITSLPPRPVYAACIACGLPWADWMSLLGSRDFDLVIEAHSVLVTYYGIGRPQTIVVWSRPTTAAPSHRPVVSRLSFDEPQVPISKLGQQSLMQASLKATVNSALARAHSRTLAQQLLESDDKQEAEEIFDMISLQTSIMSPTPTREGFALEIPSMSIFPSPLSSPESLSPNSSRPSSRSSTFSTFSSDDEESVTSASSISSFDFLATTKPALSPISRPMPSAAAVKPTFNRHAPAFVPRQSQPTRVVVDNTKLDKTKYLYQGGVSTVLTGGVMLGGAPATSSSAAAPSSVPKYRAPVGGRKLPSPPTKSLATSAQSWRRATPRV